MRRYVSLTTIYWLFFAGLFLPEIANAQEKAARYEVPEFRTVTDTAAPDLQSAAPVRLITDADFAPFSFLSNSGSPAGLSVELAMAACEAAKIACTVAAKPFGEIMDALASGSADAAVTGPRLDEATLGRALMTRPYFRVMGRFAALAASPLASPAARDLRGKRIAVVGGTVHAQWLQAYYGSATIVAVDNWPAAGEALKKGEADALFGDNLQTIYWVAGEASAGCCKLLGGAFSDFDYFSRNLSFLVRPDRPELRAALDYGLDMAQKNGATAKIIQSYVPLSPW